jgi:hypothetical protein
MKKNGPIGYWTRSRYEVLEVVMMGIYIELGIKGWR